MTDLIQLARFGNRRGAHGLIAHTGVDEELLGRAIWHSDLPPQGDAESLGDFVSGFRLGDYYVVQHTRPDRTASRAGMVVTTSAFVPREQISSLDLHALLSRLKEGADDLEAWPQVDFAEDYGTHNHAAGAEALATCLLAHRRVIWSGAGFLSAISCLWRHLDRHSRQRLVFGAGFHPDALSVPVEEHSIVVLVVPTSLVSRWRRWDVVEAGTAAPPDPVREALFGPRVGPVAALANRVLDGEVTFDQWSHLVSLSELESRLDSLDHEEVRAAIQLTGLLAPDVERASALKHRELERLAVLTPGAPFADVRGFRSLPWKAFVPVTDLGRLVKGWTREVLSDSTRTNDLREAILEALGGPADSLRRELDRSLRDLLREIGVPECHLPPLLVAERAAEVFGWLVEASRSVTELDAAIADEIARSSDIPSWGPALAVKRNLPRTHASVVDICDSTAAWRSHLKLKAHDDVADDILEHRVGPEATIEAALAIGDEKLIQRAAVLIASSPDRLPKRDLADVRYRALWCACIRRGMDAWAVISPHDAVGPLLSLLLQGETVDDAAFDALGETTAADIRDHPNRPSIWSLLPASARRAFLSATADALGRRIKNSDPVPEPPLAKAMLEHDVLGRIAHDDPLQAIVVIRVLPGSEPKHAELVATRGRFESGASVALGDLVLSRRWKRAAETIVDLASTRSDLRPAAERVSTLFGIVERIRRYISFKEGSHLATRDELRDAIHETVARLYAEGPAQDAIWERAGGSRADIPDGTTGRHRWGLALRAVEAGKAGAPSLADLLTTMHEDYPHNDDLHALLEVNRLGES